MQYRCLSVLCLLSAETAFAQNVITVFAGSDYRFPSNGLLALQAPLSTPAAITTDSKGNVYFADLENLRVMRVSPDGILTVVAGNGILGNSGDGGPATAASLYGISGLAVDAAGNLFISDFQFVVIRKVSPDGIITRVAGDPKQAMTNPSSGDGQPAAKATLRPQGMVFDPQGNLYICDSQSNRVRKINPQGIISTFAGTGVAGSTGDGSPAVNAALFFPLNIAIDGAGNLYVSESGSGNLRKITPQGIISTVGKTNAVFTVDPAGNLYYFNGNSEILKRTPAGTITTFAGGSEGGFAGDGGSAASAKINGFKGIHADSSGNLFISDDGNQRVRKVSGGIITTIAGNGKFRFSPDGIVATSAALYKPAGVAVDKAGNVYISESNNNRVRRVGTDGVITTFAGTGLPGSTGDGGPAASAQLNIPGPLAVDAAGNLYIGETGGARVRRVTPAGIISTYAGNGNFTPDGDGVAATSVAVPLPAGLAVDAAGNLFISTQTRVRRVTPAGVITTIVGKPAGNACVGTDNGDGGPVDAAKACAPAGLAFDTAGNLYFADTSSQTARVRKVSINQTVTTFAGGQTIGSATNDGQAIHAFLTNLGGLAVDAAGNLYISASARVHRVTQAGAISTFAGVGSFGLAANEGGLATRAGLNTPNGLALDAVGNLFISDGGFLADSSSYRVWKVLAQLPSFQLSTSTLSFTAPSSGAPATLQRFTAIGGVTGVPFSVTANTGSGGSWLTVTPSSGLTTRIVDVTADPANLVPGDYQGTIRVTAQNTVPLVQTIAVPFKVTAAPPPNLQTDRDSLTFTFPRQAAARSQTLKLTNAGGGTIDITATASTTTGGAWLSVAPPAASVTPRTPVALSITADPAGLAPGTYSGAIAIGGSQSKTIPVLLTISTLDKAILLTQTGLSFTTVVGGGVAPPQDFGVLNLGVGSMPFTVTTSTLTGGAWLSATPTSGSTDAASTAVPAITLNVNQANLAAGVYYGLVRVDAPGAANSPQVATVFLQVLPAGSNPGSVIQPSELTFSGISGILTPGAKEVTIYNLSGTPLNYVSSAFINGIGGTRHTPISAVVTPQSPVRLLVQPNYDPLPAGETRQSITLQFSDGTVRAISLRLVAAPASSVAPSALTDGTASESSSASTGGRAAAGCNPTKLLPAFQSLGQASSVPAGWPAAISVDVKDDCGDPLVTGGVTVSFSNGDVPISLQSLKDGRWQGTWQSRNAQTSGVAVTLTAQDPVKKLAGTSEISADLRAAQTPPATAENAVVSTAAPVSFVPLGPGALFTIYGDRLADSVASAESVPLPTTLGNAQVIMGGQLLPLFYASPGQINAIVPYNLQVNTQHQVLISRGTTYSFPVPVTLAPAQPGIFTYDGVHPIVVAIRGSRQFLVTPETPAAPGDVLVFYCGGFGAVDAPVTAGDFSPGSPLPSVTAGVKLSIGGTDVPVAFAGLTPGSVGLYQLNAQLPDGIATGAAVPVILTTAGQTSPSVGLAIQR